MDVLKEKIGLIASSGTLPIDFIREASQKNVSVIAIALNREIARAIKKQGLTDALSKMPIGQVDMIFQSLKNKKINKVVMLGKFDKATIFQGLRFDKRAQSLIKQKFDLQDVSLMELIISEFEKEGFEVLKQTEYLSSILAPEGVLTNRIPDEREWEDIHHGLPLAYNIAGMDIGQTIVVKNRAVISVEALEGTDAAILRAGKLAKSGTVVVKVSRPKQDLRYDIPAVGIKTLKIMEKIKSVVLAVEANKTFLLDRENLIKYADLKNICIVGEKINK
ncbi:UDP-2,3-diacylglucosamine diphosphatase LpxI [Candidatus Desantisbacteria bacterium]|nr:UDP-2,3-diacylglucosamine diphosphatase LpxI [Candidatus Desantisbacteria bacterium]